MSTYRGPADYLIESGQKFQCTADLTSASPDDWGGTLTFDDVTLVHLLQRNPDGHLIIGIQSGEVSRRGTPNWSPTKGGPYIVDVFGSGVAPF
ncbi:hypothetical protein ACH4N4_30200 [Streptomyces microflavus]|uniref:hypothetical protein n=1 Tax=Streptomyces microflavus TaxID=1919 RepID=UPI00324A5625